MPNEELTRGQFTFYRSYYDALQTLPKRDRLAVYEAIAAYALDGVEPNLSGAASTAFILIRPTLDSGRKKAASGKRGGKKRETNDKQSESKTEAKRKQTVSKQEANDKQGEIVREKEIEKEIEIEIENEDECLYARPRVASPAVAAVCGYYLDRINPSASQTSLEELSAYAETMGEAVCKRAMDIALDNKKATWAYIRGILRRLQSQGVKCLADWDAIEKKREVKSGGSDTGHTESPWHIEQTVL